MSQQQGRLPLLQEEMRQIDSKVAGWTETLSKADLSALVRGQVEQQLGVALQRKQSIVIEAETLTASIEQVDELLDPSLAVARLQRLEEVLAQGSPSDINVELSLHIESILVNQDGSVVMRTNRLGVFEGISQILSVGTDVPENASVAVDGENGFQIRPRALSRRRTTGSVESSHLAMGNGMIEAGHVPLPEKWVDTAIFQMPEATCWSKENAHEVAALRKAGRTHAELAEHFGKTVPTIRKALQIAAQTDESLGQLPKKMPRPMWARDHAAEVAAKRAAGMSVLELAAEYQKSDTTIRQALKFAEEAGK